MKLKEQLILGLEASGSPVSVGLMDQGKPLGLLWLDVAANSSETLMASVDYLLKAAGKTKEDLQGIALSLGPGSFTSIRVGLSTAEGLGLALNLPQYGVGLLDCFASSISYGARRVHVIQNAYKGELYYGLYDCSLEKPKSLQDLSLIKPDSFVSQLRVGDLILGTGIEVLRSKGLAWQEHGAIADESVARQANGLLVAQMMMEEEAQLPGGPPLEPIYIRASEAELTYAKNFAPRSLTDR